MAQGYPASGAGSVRPHAVTSAGSNTFTYDANGNQITRTIGGVAYTLSWDAENRLIGYSGNGTSASYLYDGDGVRVKTVITDTGGMTTTVHIGGYFEWVNGSTARKYYYHNGQRVAMREGGELYFLLGDHLGSTSVSYRVSDGQTITQRYYAWGDIRPGPDNALPTDYTFTGQRLDDGSQLVQMGARWYDSRTGRWLSADTIVPEPGNPQSLNRFAYVRNNPLRFIDPSGHDPLDQVWQSEFERVHHRRPAAEDILIRLFSIAFPGEWDWSVFYDVQGNYIHGSLEKVFRFERPADWTWKDMPGALERLAGWYNRGEEGLYSRDVGSLFGGLPNRFEAPGTWSAVSNARNPVRVWVYLSSEGLPTSLMGTSDPDANVHHWAWGFTMGAAYGPGGSLINTGREISQFRGDWRNMWSDIMIGNSGAALGLRFRVLGLSDISHAWHFYMLD